MVLRRFILCLQREHNALYGASEESPHSLVLLRQFSGPLLDLFFEVALIIPPLQYQTAVLQGSLGADEYITKPFDPQALLEMINRLVANCPKARYKVSSSVTGNDLVG